MAANNCTRISFTQILNQFLSYLRESNRLNFFIYKNPQIIKLIKSRSLSKFDFDCLSVFQEIFQVVKMADISEASGNSKLIVKSNNENRSLRHYLQIILCYLESETWACLKQCILEIAKVIRSSLLNAKNISRDYFYWNTYLKFSIEERGNKNYLVVEVIVSESLRVDWGEVIDKCRSMNLFQFGLSVNDNIILADNSSLLPVIIEVRDNLQYKAVIAKKMLQPFLLEFFYD